MAPVPSSDEYDDPSFEITEDILTSLKDTEDRFSLSLSQVPANNPPTAPPPPPPPPKKHKPNGYKPVPDDDDPPDIIVLDEKGTYGVLPKPPHVSAPSGTARPAQPVRRVTAAVSGVSSRPAPPARPPARPPLPSRSSSGGIQQSVPARPSPLAQSTVPPKPPEPAQAMQPGPGRSTTTNPSDANDQFSALLAQVERLKTDNEKLQAAQRAAEEAHYAKAGEAANIRRAMERQTAQSADELARMKTKMEELASAKQRMEKEMRIEMERLKTNLTFRAHELETSVRKPAWSVRKKPPTTQSGPNSQLNVPPPPSTFVLGRTPARLPSRNNAGPSAAPPGALTFSSPDAPPPTVKPPARTKAPGPKFAGFHNSFAEDDSAMGRKRRSSPVRESPVRSSQRLANGDSSPLRGKGKGKEREREDEVGWGVESEFVVPTQAGESRDEREGDVEMEMGDGETLEDAGEVGEDAMEVEQEPQVEEEDELFFGRGDPIDWREELNHLVFSHRSLLVPPPPTDPPDLPPLTLQRLLTISLPSSLPPQTASLYSSACADVLGAFGREHVGKAAEAEWKEEMRGVLRGLVGMASVYCHAAVLGGESKEQLVTCLASTLDLLSSLLASLPSAARSFVLSYTGSESADGPPLLLATLTEVVHVLLPVGGDGLGEAVKRGLGEGTMFVLESVAWGIGEEDVPRLGMLPRAQGFLATLLDKKQSPWLVERATRLLCLFSTHAALFRPLLSFPDEVPVETDKGKGKENDYTHIPLVDLLCALLVSGPVGASFSQSHAIRQSAVATLTLLSIIHPDGPSLLIESREVVPSVVKSLLRETTVVWDEEDELVDMPQSHQTILHTMHLALTLLHHLAGFTQLRPKLQQAARYHNGLAHAFVLAIGRLSYADAPDCLDVVGRGRVEAMREQARDLIESVVEGPEGDLIWAAYQDAGEDEEEERGAMPGEGNADEEAVAAEVAMVVDTPLEAQHGR